MLSIMWSSCSMVTLLITYVAHMAAVIAMQLEEGDIVSAVVRNFTRVHNGKREGRKQKWAERDVELSYGLKRHSQPVLNSTSKQPHIELKCPYILYPHFHLLVNSEGCHCKRGRFLFYSNLEEANSWCCLLHQKPSNRGKMFIIEWGYPGPIIFCATQIHFFVQGATPSSFY